MLNVNVNQVSVKENQQFGYHCAIDWNRLQAVRMYEVPPDEPPMGILMVDVMDGYELTRAGYEYLRWEDGRLKAVARMMGILQPSHTHLN